MKQARSNPSFVRFADLGIAKCDVTLGKRDVELPCLRAVAEKNRIRLAEGWICNFLGEILLNLGGDHLAEAEQKIRKAIEVDTRNGTKFHLGKDHALYGEYFKRQGDRANAQEELGKAIDILRQCDADGWVEKNKKELATLQ